jgi:hypothetical protein
VLRCWDGDRAARSGHEDLDESRGEAWRAARAMSNPESAGLFVTLRMGAVTLKNRILSSGHAGPWPTPAAATALLAHSS